MPSKTSAPESFETFGDLLKFLRRRERLTQLELSIAVGYSEAQIGRLEKNQRRPDLTALKALFIPALHLEDEPELCARLLELAGASAVLPETPVSTSTTNTNLPVSLTSFIGREKEQAEIVNLLGKHRLVTLTGVGGIGKTRLASQVGQRLLKDYPDGVWFVALDSLFNPTLIPQSIASVFGIREGANRPITELLTNYLRGKAIVLIFDNCEHLLDASTTLITILLQNCPKLKILTTSRETLNVEGGATYYLPSLSIPQTEMPIDKLTEYESIQMFTERAALASASFTLTNQNAQTVLDICRQVDGLPLALELAAARVNILQVEEILNQLHNSFSFLASDNRPTLPRQQTIRASMEWSSGLLSEAEQTFFRQLSVFAGGWTLESAQSVCGGDVIGLTSALVKKSLIMVSQEAGSVTRYRYHEIVRLYAQEKLAESGQAQDTRTRHLQHFLQFSEQAEPALRGPTQIEWMSRLNDERANIRATLEWASETNVEAGLYISSRLRRFWESFDIRDGTRWLGEFIRNPESETYPLAKARALLAYGWLLSWRHQGTQALAAAQSSLDLFRACGDRLGETDSLLLVGLWSDAPEKLDCYKQSLVLAQSLGDTWRQACALCQLDWGDANDQRLERWERSIDLFRQSGDLYMLAHHLSLFGYFAILEGKLELAQSKLEESISLNHQLNDKDAKCALLHALGQIAVIQGDYDKAREYFQEALDTWEELGTRLNALWCRAHLGYVALYEGKITEACTTFAETVTNFQKDGNPHGVAFVFEGMAGFYIAVSKPEVATRLIGQADAIRKQTNDTRPKFEQANVDKIIATCIAKLGEVVFANAYEDGKKMSMEDAVAYALKEV